MSTKSNRPTSPHLQIYRLPLTGIISISHRITGIFLSLGLIIIALIISALATGSEAQALVQSQMHLWPVRILTLGFVFALFFHICHGIRHLLWDMGYSLGKDTLTRYALLELGLCLLLTILFFAWEFYGL